MSIFNEGKGKAKFVDDDVAVNVEKSGGVVEAGEAIVGTGMPIIDKALRAADKINVDLPDDANIIEKRKEEKERPVARTFMIPPSLLVRAKMVADREERSVNWVVNTAINHYLTNVAKV